VETPRQKDQRYRLYTLLNVGRSKLGMQDEDYRALLARHGATEREGQVSATTLSIPALENVLDELKAKGFKPTSKTKPRRPQPTNISNASDAQLNLMRHIWGEMGKAGILRDETERGLQAWVRASTRRKTGAGYERLEFLPHDVAQELIERLKNWAARANVELHRHG
jgi:phage gp16-like protein